MSELDLLVAVCDRNQVRRFLTFYEEYGISITFSALGHGTAASETLDAFGLEATEKAVLFSPVERKVWEQARRGLEKGMKIDIPGTGVAFLIPVSSVGGKKQLAFLTQGQDFSIGEESVLKDTNYALLVVIANQGYSDLVMDAARSAGATGGTVIHARGAGRETAEKFLGVSLAQEKEMLFLVVRTEKKNQIMKAIMEGAGLETRAASIVFSLPVVDTAGMRLLEDAD